MLIFCKHLADCEVFFCDDYTIEQFCFMCKLRYHAETRGSQREKFSAFSASLREILLLNRVVPLYLKDADQKIQCNWF